MSTSFGALRLASFEAGQTTPAGWRRFTIEKFDWTRRYFGPDSNWTRYTYLDGGGAQARSGVPIIADIVSTSRRSALSAYGIETCYQFHGFTTVQPALVDLGNGVRAGVVTWTNPDDQTTWTTLWWHWPVTTPESTRYERVALLVNDAPKVTWNGPSPAQEKGVRGTELKLAQALRGTSDQRPLTSREVAGRNIVVGFGRELVASRTPATQQP